MKILFITSTRLGDAVLSTGLLAHIAESYDTPEITVACGPLVEPLFEMAPGVVRVIALSKKRWGRHWWDLWKETAPTHWDVVVDLRNSPVSRFLRAERRYIWRRADPSLHKVEQLAQVMGLETPPGPVLRFTSEQLIAAKKLVPDGPPVLGIGPAANWPGKTWPRAYFIELIRRLTAPGGLLPGARIAVIAAAGEEAQALPVLESVPPDRRVDLIGKGDPALAAACLKRCALFIGNDSGLMHCAAAAGIPTLGLFGPSWPHLYRPWGAYCAYVSTPETYAELTAFKGYHPDTTTDSLMHSLTVDMAEAAARQLWQSLER